MSEMILKTTTLPKALLRLIRTEKVKLRETDGEIRIIPVVEDTASDRFLAIKHAAVKAEDKMRRLYDLCGSGADLEMTVDSFLAMTHDEKELNDDQFICP